MGAAAVPTGRRGDGPTTSAAQDHAHARGQLARRERLDHVVVGTDLEADDAVDLLVSRSQEDHRHIAECAQRTAGLEAVHVRQAHIEDHQVKRRRTQPRKAFATERAMLGCHAVGSEGVEDGVRDGGFVFDDEDARCLHFDASMRRPDGPDGSAWRFREHAGRIAHHGCAAPIRCLACLGAATGWGRRAAEPVNINECGQSGCVGASLMQMRTVARRKLPPPGLVAKPLCAAECVARKSVPQFAAFSWRALQPTARTASASV